jgi:stage V sporulation protein SpoVS
MDSKNEEIKELRVKADRPDATDEERKTSVKKLAGAVAHALRLNGTVNVRCFGNACIGKATKAITIARGYVAVHGFDLYFSTSFIDAVMNGDKKTGICFHVFPQDR